MNYKVTYAIDSLDSKPTIKFFQNEFDAEQWINESVQQRMSFLIEHSPYTISEKEYKEIEENEYSLVRIEKL